MRKTVRPPKRARRTNIIPLSDTVRALRAKGRKRATIGEYKVTISNHHCQFQPKEEDAS